MHHQCEACPDRSGIVPNIDRAFALDPGADVVYLDGTHIGRELLAGLPSAPPPSGTSELFFASRLVLFSSFLPVVVISTFATDGRALRFWSRFERPSQMISHLSHNWPD